MQNFDGLQIDPACANRTLLFCVGRGGDPTRHRPMLEHLALSGCRIIAPRFDRPTSPMISAEVMTHRVQVMEGCAAASDPNLPLVGLGHSMGATTLLILAGAQAYTIGGTRVTSSQPTLFHRLAMLAPATDFFMPPQAMDAVHTKIQAWSGTKDTITPPGQIADFVDRLPSICDAEHKTAPDAGHFTFMNQPPPQMDEPHPDREVFLMTLVQSLDGFLAG